MTELKAVQNLHDKAICNYLVIYKFRSKLANIAFEDLIISNFKEYFIYCNIENAQSFYLSIPLNRVNILLKFKNHISKIKYFEDSDFLYFISRLFDSNDEKEIIGHEIIKEQDKTWSDIVKLLNC